MAIPSNPVKSYQFNVQDRDVNTLKRELQLRPTTRLIGCTTVERLFEIFDSLNQERMQPGHPLDVEHGIAKIDLFELSEYDSPLTKVVGLASKLIFREKLRGLACMQEAASRRLQKLFSDRFGFTPTIREDKGHLYAEVPFKKLPGDITLLPDPLLGLTAGYLSTKDCLNLTRAAKRFRRDGCLTEVFACNPRHAAKFLASKPRLSAEHPINKGIKERLKEFSAPQNMPVEQLRAILTHFPNIRELELCHSTQLQVVAEFPNIRTLRLNFGPHQLPFAQIKTPLSALKNLESLELSHFSRDQLIADEGGSIFDALPETLSVLNLGACALEDQDVRRLLRFTQLDKLSLAGNREVRGTFFNDLPAKLTSFDCSGCSIDNEGLVKMHGRLWQLRVLDLSYNSLLKKSEVLQILTPRRKLEVVRCWPRVEFRDGLLFVDKVELLHSDNILKSHFSDFVIKFDFKLLEDNCSRLLTLVQLKPTIWQTVRDLFQKCLAACLPTIK